MENECKELSLAIKYAIVCLQFLLHSRPVECWKGDAETFEMFEKIINYGLDQS
jgi:hypothetical protein